MNQRVGIGSKKIKRIVTTQTKNEFADILILWWNKNSRVFPWRRTRNPYAILIAEVLLRKTTSKQVAKVYPKFMSKYPTPKNLLHASVRELAKDLKPLGIYKVRATHLKKMAKILASKHHGTVPRSQIELLQLPGVSLYTAGAVRCFAYGEDTSLVDTNVVRVLQRVFDIKSRKKQPSADLLYWRFSAKLVPLGKAREFNWALLDFAAKVCTARKPLCDKCPLINLCTRAKSMPETTAVEG